MKIMKITALTWGLALAAVLAITGTGWAKKPTFAGPGADGQLDSTRTIVTLSVPVPQQTCKTNTTTQTYTYSAKAYILQPSGRILAIGFSDPTAFDCALDQNINVTVDAIQGLSFKPGPATVIYQVMETTTTTIVATDPVTLATTTTTTTTTNVVNEYGSTVNLHP